MPTWTKDDLRAFENRRLAKIAEPQRAVCDGALAEVQREVRNSNRVAVRITAFRVRQLDPDNCCPKYFIDGLRYAGLLPDDRPQDIELTVAQAKVETKAEERTEIELIPL